MKRQRDNQCNKMFEGKVTDLSSVPLTHSETNLLRKGLTFYPKGKVNPSEVENDINEFIRKVTWKEHFAPEEIDSDYEEEPYTTTVLDKLNDEKKRPSKQINEPLIKALESTIKKDTERHFQSYSKTKDNLSKREEKH